MEIEKAIQLLKADKEIIIEASGKEDFKIDNLDEFDLAIQALEKQMPHTLVHPFNLYYNGGSYVPYLYTCKCGSIYGRNDYEYCPDCGQKLDWGVGQ